MDLFCLLLKSGLTFPDALSLSFQSHAEIEKRLEQGIPFSRIVRSQKERNMKQLGVLMEIFDLSLALEFHEQLRKARKTLHGTLLKKSGYPLFLMAFASGLVCFFADSILPSLLGEGGSSSLSLLNLLKLVLAESAEAGFPAVLDRRFHRCRCRRLDDHVSAGGFPDFAASVFHSPFKDVFVHGMRRRL